MTSAINSDSPRQRYGCGHEPIAECALRARVVGWSPGREFPQVAEPAGLDRPANFDTARQALVTAFAGVASSSFPVLSKD